MMNYWYEALHRPVIGWVWYGSILYNYGAYWDRKGEGEGERKERKKKREREGSIVRGFLLASDNAWRPRSWPRKHGSWQWRRLWTMENLSKEEVLAFTMGRLSSTSSWSWIKQIYRSIGTRDCWMSPIFVGKTLDVIAIWKMTCLSLMFSVLIPFIHGVTVVAWVVCCWLGRVKSDFHKNGRCWCQEGGFL